VATGETDDYVSQLNRGSSNILVAVRARPLTKKEREHDSFEIVEILDNKVVVLLDPTSEAPAPEEAFRMKRSKEKQYAFDFVFDKASTQQEVYEKTTGFLLEGVISGFNATVFAYGSTGAGKTYTMVGDHDSPGVMLMTILELFRSMNATAFERSYKVKLSYLEIYNEVIRDLISGGNEHLDIWEDPVKGVNVAGLTEIQADSAEAVVDMIRVGNRRRTCEPTKANETSSRSHAVLQISVEQTDKAAGTEAQIILGKLSLIDLAGSERASNTMNRGLRLIEGANINRSLLALGNCINALYEANMKGTKAYIPYRDSKLTRILKDSLGGNCRTVMIACISPCVKTFEDTHNTLKYANRAKNIKTSVQRNVLNVSYHVSKYTTIIANLKSEISELRSKLSGRQRSVLPNIVATEKYTRELAVHFQEEAATVNRMHEIEHNIEKLGFTLFSRLTELNQAEIEGARQRMLQSEEKVLKSTIMTRNHTLEAEQNKLNALHRKREVIEQGWVKANLAPEQMQELQLAMKEQILLVNSALIKMKDDHAGAMVKQRESYIHLLVGQLKIRDSIIDSQTSVLVKKHIPIKRDIFTGLVESEGLDDIGTVAKVCFPSHINLHDKSFTKSTVSLARHSKQSLSRIPLPSIKKASYDSGSRLSTNSIKSQSTVPSGMISPKSYRSPVHKPAKTDRKVKQPMNLADSVSSDSSNSTALTDKKALARKVAERVRRSPYVRVVKDKVARPRRQRIEEKNIKYGSVIRHA
jgi:kinesin family protein 18/19